MWSVISDCTPVNLVLGRQSVDPQLKIERSALGQEVPRVRLPGASFRQPSSEGVCGLGFPTSEGWHKIGEGALATPRRHRLRERHHEIANESRHH